MSWVGFTDEELKRLKQQHGDEREPATTVPNVKRAAMNSRAGKKQRPRAKIRPRNTESAKVGSGECGEEKKTMSTIESHGTGKVEEERETSSPECEKSESEERGRLEKTKSSLRERCPAPWKGKPQESNQETIDYSGSNLASAETDVRVIDEPERIKAMELSALQKMQQKQKEMEEENKRKKAALQETIKKRYKKTQAEAQTLTMVQKELGHLDHLLSGDVTILRDQIDQACKDYLYAQKRYEKAEAEFIAAKLDLHHRTEKKELLTEHLYTVIQANEERKAKKLEALMVKLNLSQDSIEMHEEAVSQEKDVDKIQDLSTTTNNSSNLPKETVQENAQNPSIVEMSHGSENSSSGAAETDVTDTASFINTKSDDSASTVSVPPESISDHNMMS